MKSAPQRPIFVSVNIKQKYMKLILRLGLILFTGFISYSISTVIWNGRYKRSGTTCSDICKAGI